jgi:hypothetical protein
MPTTRSIFYGFGSWVGQQTGLTTCGWWPQDPNTLSPPFDNSKLINNDLSKNPQAAKTGGITQAQIQVDDAPANGGLTKIGPSFPAGSLINGCWLEKNVYDALAAGVKPPRIPSGIQCHDYELTNVYYWSGPLANRRFFGFYATINSEQGQSALCSIWPASYSLVPGQQPAGSWWLNLTTVAHPIETGFTQIGVGVGKPKQGALFLDAPTVSSLVLTDPKLPRYAGLSRFPRSR